MSEYHKGNIEEDSRDYRGWLVGSFAARGSARYTPDVEVKYWKFDGGFTDHPNKTSRIVEVTMVLGGIAIGHVNDEPVRLEAGEYVVIQPDTPNNLVVYTEPDTWGITIKAPSDPSAKVLIGESECQNES